MSSNMRDLNRNLLTVLSVIEVAGSALRTNYSRPSTPIGSLTETLPKAIITMKYTPAIDHNPY